MKKSNPFLIALAIIIILGTIFFCIDYNRAVNDKNPLFCIPIGGLQDGGTIEYLGLGYKVIRFNRLLSLSNDNTESRLYTAIRIGPIFMNYDDFDSDFKKYEELRDSLYFYFTDGYGTFSRPESPSPTLGKTFYAEIEKIEKDSLLVNGLDVNSYNYRSQFYLELSQKPLVVWNNTVIELSDLKVGNRISITFSGDIKETSPAQISNILRIELLEDELTGNIEDDFQEYLKAENVKMKIVEGTLTNTKTDVVITDSNEIHYPGYGEWFRIDKKVNGIWRELDQKADATFKAIGYIVGQDNKLELTVDWSKIYGELDPGEYRLVKNVYDNSQEYKNYSDGYRYFDAEFTIE